MFSKSDWLRSFAKDGHGRLNLAKVESSKEWNWPLLTHAEWKWLPGVSREPITITNGTVSPILTGHEEKNGHLKFLESL